MSFVRVSFGSEKKRQAQLRTWIETSAKLLFLSVFHQEKTTDLIFDKTQWLNDSNTLGNLDFLEVETCNQPDLDWQKTVLWCLIKPRFLTSKTDDYWLICPQNLWHSLLKECFRLGVFQVGKMDLDEFLFVQIRFAPRYLILKLMEEYSLEAYWKDPFNTFIPLDFHHPMSRLLSDSRILILRKKEIFELPHLDFENALDEISWQFPVKNAFLKETDKPMNVEIEVHLDSDPSLNPPHACLWFYEEIKKDVLENWIANLSLVQREEYLILASDLPFRGFFLKFKDEKKISLASPPTAHQSFYRLYPSEEIYCPVKKRLMPPLPFSQFERIISLPLGKSMVLFEESDTLISLILDETRFEEMQSIVSYILFDYQEEIQRIESGIYFLDPEIELYEWEGEAPVFKEERQKNSSPAEEAFVSQPKQTEAPVDLAEIRIQKKAGSEEIFKEIQSCRDMILQNPRKNLSRIWQKLGWLESGIDSFQEGIQCLEMGLIWEKDPGMRKAVYTQILQNWCLIFETTLQDEFEKISKKPNQNWSQDDLNFAVLYILSSQEPKDALQKIAGKNLLVYMEENLSQIPVTRLLHFSYFLKDFLELQPFFLLSVKDKILSELYEKGIYKIAVLPKFITGKQFFNSKENHIEDFYRDVFPFFASNNQIEVIQNRLFYFLIFSVGYALNKNPSMQASLLTEARKLVNYTNQPVHDLLYRWYETLGKRILASESRYLSSEEFKESEQLSLTEKYMVGRLLEYTLTLRNLEEEHATVYYQDFIALKEKSNFELIQLIPQLIQNLRVDTKYTSDRISYQKKLAYCTILGFLPRLGEVFSFQILEMIDQELNFLSSQEHRASVIAKMLEVAILFERQDAIERLQTRFFTIFEEIDKKNHRALEALLQPVCRYLPSILSQSQISKLIETVSQGLSTTISGARIRVYLTRILEDCGFETEARLELENAFKIYVQKSEEMKTSNEVNKQDVFLFLVFLLHQMHASTRDIKIFLTRLFIQNFDSIQDFLSTNRFFSLSKLLAMEFIVLCDQSDEEINPEFKRYLMELEASLRKEISAKMREVTEKRSQN